MSEDDRYPRLRALILLFTITYHLVFLLDWLLQESVDSGGVAARFPQENRRGIASP
jgi:hypothetical protein